VANIGPNKGRTLRPAAHRFAAMLIEEVRAVTGMNYREITHALFVEGYPLDADATSVDPDRAWEYTLPLTHYRARVPKFDQLQILENDVAYLLKRPAQTLVIEDLGVLSKHPHNFSAFITVPRENLSWKGRDWCPDTLAITYSSHWPTYGDLVQAGLEPLFRWQYGYLWEQGDFQRASFGFPDTDTIETLIEQRMRRLALLFEGLTYLLHCDRYKHSVSADFLNALETIAVSEDELRLYCIAWGPKGLHRWRALDEEKLTRLRAIEDLNIMHVPEICRKTAETKGNFGHSVEMKFLDKSINYL
jgi:hypothetical protein